MKAEIISEEKEPDFKPVTICITIESKEEVASLWHRLNLNDTYITDAVKDYYIFPDSSDRPNLKFSSLSVLWNKVDTIWRDIK